MLLFIYLSFVMQFASAFTRLASNFPQSACRATWRRSHRYSLANRTLSHSSQSTTLSVPTAEDMEDAAGILASLLLETGRPEGAIVLLGGDLGAGKTAFARGFVRAATGDWNIRVTSPTFLLSNTYRISRIDRKDVESSDIEYVAWCFVQMLCVIYSRSYLFPTRPH